MPPEPSIETKLAAVALLALSAFVVLLLLLSLSRLG